MSTLQDPSRPPNCNDQAFLTGGQYDLHTSLLDNEPVSKGELHLSESVTFASRLSPFEEPTFDGCDVPLITRAPSPLSEPPFFDISQHAPSWSPSPSVFLDQGSQLGNFSLQALPRSPSTDLTPETVTVPDLFFKTAPTPDRSSISCVPVSEQGYQAPEWARDFGAGQASMAIIQELSSDTTAMTAPSGEMLVVPATARETLGGIVPGNGVTSPSVYNHSSTIPHSARRNEGAASPYFLSTGQASRRPMAASSVASIRVLSSGRDRGRFSCRVCDVSFVQRQGFNRHNRDKHQPRNICSHCGVFKWSPARRYLFTKHFERDHLGVAL
ncbi:hypothetical protein BJY52DRAFT_1285138 [Lactarius psammicola]|nr:hypothetical protein BJY52DRAFT_1285138 [Lactarius psammicola]